MLLLLHGASGGGGGPVLVDSDGNPLEYSRQQYAEGTYMRQQVRISALYGLFGGTFSAQADFERFVTAFNYFIANPTKLTPGELDYLDYYNDGVLGYDDRDYWLDRLIDENLTVTSRLSWSVAAPSTKTESDPLGLFTGQTNVIVIDSANTMKVYVNESSTNLCYTDEARTIPAATTTLFTGALTTSQYNQSNTIWGDLRSFNENGGSNRRRFPGDGVEVTVYVRGGSYTLDREIIMQMTQAGATAQSRIIIRNYPGEVVNWFFGNQENTPTSFDNTVEWTVQRPNVKWRGLTINGYRIRSGSDRVFAPLMFSFPNAATGWEVSDCTIQNFRCIAGSNGGSAHADAATLPHYVDYAFYYRSAAAADVTEKSLNSSGILVGATSSGLIQDTSFLPTGDDFPLNSETWDRGHSVDLAQSSSVTIRRCTFDGLQGHMHIRCQESGSSACQNVTIEDCYIRNPNNTCVGFSVSSGGIFRRNIVTGWASKAGASDGTGLSTAWLVGGEVVDNVFWQGDEQGAGQNYGIDVGKIQGDNDYTVTDSVFRRNVFYRSGMSFGCNSSAPTNPVDIALVTRNEVSYNVFYGLSDYSHSLPGFDAPITTNMGAHQSNFGGNSFFANIFYRTDGDTACLVEQLPGSTQQDYPVSPAYSWFYGNVVADPGFADPENGDFRVDSYSPAWAVLGDAPLVESWLDREPMFQAKVDVQIPPQRVQSTEVTYKRQ